MELWDSWSLLSTEGVQWDVVWRENGVSKLVTVPDNGGWMAGFTAHCWCSVFCKLGLWQCPITLQVNGCSRGGLLGAFLSGLWLCLSFTSASVVWTSGWSLWSGWAMWGPATALKQVVSLWAGAARWGPVSSQQVVLPTALPNQFIFTLTLEHSYLNSVVLRVVHITVIVLKCSPMIQSSGPSSAVVGMFLSTQWFHRKSFRDAHTGLTASFSLKFPFCWFHFLLQFWMILVWSWTVSSHPIVAFG